MFSTCTLLGQWRCLANGVRLGPCAHLGVGVRAASQSPLYCAIKGRSADPDMNRLVFLAQLRIAQLSARVWFDYVPSTSNVADLPTRLDDAALQRLSRLGERVPMRLPPEWALSCEWSELASLLSSVR